MQEPGNLGLGQSGKPRAGYSARVVRASIVENEPGEEAEASSELPSLSPRQAEAEAILAAAKSEAEALLLSARAEAQSLIDNANAEAKHISDVRLGQELLTFNRRLLAELDAVRPMLARMVIEAVESIIGMLPDEEIAERMVRRALRDLDAATKAVLYASRADYVFLGQIVGKMQVAGDHSVHSVQVDGDLETGICRLDAAGISLEIGMKAQLELLESLLLREEAPNQTESDSRDAEPSSIESKLRPTTFSASPPLGNIKKTTALTNHMAEMAVPTKSIHPISSGGGTSAFRSFAAEPKYASPKSVMLPAQQRSSDNSGVAVETE